MESFGMPVAKLAKPPDFHVFLKLALAFYLLAAGAGLLLRFFLVSPIGDLNFANTLHAHSHTLYFGWGALALFTLYFTRLKSFDATVRRTLWAIAAIGVATFTAFLHSGYGRPGIAVSAASLVVWLFAVSLFLRRSRSTSAEDLPWLRAGSIYVLIAGAAALGRVVVLVTHANPIWGRLAVFGFLQAFATFFLLGVLGLLSSSFRRLGAPLDSRLLRLQFFWLTPLAALTFPLAVSGLETSLFGYLAKVAAMLLVIPNAMLVLNFWRATSSLAWRERLNFRSIALAAGIAALLEFIGVLTPIDGLLTLRHALVLQLHLVLVGIISAGLLLLVSEELGTPARGLLLVHQSGLAVMCIGLGLATGAALGLGLEGPRVGLWLAALGGLTTYLADAAIAVRCWKGAR
jgi:hypothetical protein